MSPKAIVYPSVRNDFIKKAKQVEEAAIAAGISKERAREMYIPLVKQAERVEEKPKPRPVVGDADWDYGFSKDVRAILDDCFGPLLAKLKKH